MGLANFIDKVSLGASQILSGFERGAFERLLLDQRLIVLFDNSACEHEGKATLDMLVRLLARLYPNLELRNTESDSLVNELVAIARSINPDIDLSASGAPTLCIAVGKTKNSLFEIPTFYGGSDRWIAKFSVHEPVGSGNSGNPIGAGAAACFLAANLFRKVFSMQLPYSEPDESFSISLLDYSVNTDSPNPALGEVNLGQFTLVGLGAIGNGVVWALNKVNGLNGTTVLIDHEPIDLSNLQRYILATQDDINRPKVDLAASYLTENGLNADQQEVKWNEYMANRARWDLELVGVCVDNVPDRIMVQATLPKYLFNAWTQPENIGVSRHLKFGEETCLSCIYFPKRVKKSISQQIADSLNLSDQERMIRDYLANDRTVDAQIIDIIAARNNIAVTELEFTLGQSLRIFYSEVVCGGVMMRLQGSNGNSLRSDIQVPSAFESALAGIMLAAELLNSKGNFRTEAITTTSQINLLRKLTAHINTDTSKKDRCICSDDIFKNSYKQRWQ